MSNTRKTHPGYFQVTAALATTWYLGLGIAFLLKGPTHSKTYALVAHYVTIPTWGLIYSALGVALLISISVPRVNHNYVRVCCGLGLMLTSFWLTLFVYALAIGKLDLSIALPAWATIGVMEFAALTEPEHGPPGRHTYG